MTPSNYSVCPTCFFFNFVNWTTNYEKIILQRLHDKKHKNTQKQLKTAHKFGALFVCSES